MELSQAGVNASVARDYRSSRATPIPISSIISAAFGPSSLADLQATAIPQAGAGAAGANRRGPSSRSRISAIGAR